MPGGCSQKLSIEHFTLHRITSVGSSYHSPALPPEKENDLVSTPGKSCQCGTGKEWVMYVFPHPSLRSSFKLLGKSRRFLTGGTTPTFSHVAPFAMSEYS